MPALRKGNVVTLIRARTWVRGWRGLLHHDIASVRGASDHAR